MIWKMVKIFQVIEAYYIQRQFNYLIIISYGGIGLGRYKELSQFDTDVHNSYLQVLCEMGIIGFVCYIVPLLINLISCIKKNRYKNNKYLKVALFIQLFFHIIWID